MKKIYYYMIIIACIAIISCNRDVRRNNSEGIETSTYSWTVGGRDSIIDNFISDYSSIVKKNISWSTGYSDHNVGSDGSIYYVDTDESSLYKFNNKTKSYNLIANFDSLGSFDKINMLYDVPGFQVFLHTKDGVSVKILNPVSRSMTTVKSISSTECTDIKVSYGEDNFGSNGKLWIEGLTPSDSEITKKFGFPVSRVVEFSTGDGELLSDYYSLVDNYGINSKGKSLDDFYSDAIRYYVSTTTSACSPYSLVASYESNPLYMEEFLGKPSMIQGVVKKIQIDHGLFSKDKYRVLLYTYDDYYDRNCYVEATFTDRSEVLRIEVGDNITVLGLISGITDVSITSTESMMCLISSKIIDDTDDIIKILGGKFKEWGTNESNSFKEKRSI